MMKLNRPPEPEDLAKNKLALTLEYEANPSKSAVWRKDYIIRPLYESSYRKCAYCGHLVKWQKEKNFYELEMNGDEKIYLNPLPGENDHLHIDHFYAKKFAKDKVVEWENLIPSCPMCNCKKSSHNVVEIPIINPYTEDPRDFFKFNYTLNVKPIIDENKQKKALKTIVVFDFVNRLSERLMALQNSIEDNMFKIFKDIDEALSTFKKGDVSKLNEVLGILRKQLNAGLANAEYGAFVATMVLKHEYFDHIKERLTEHGYWDNCFEEIENQLKEICYE